mgnify:CR=1 FL=1
MTTNHNPAAWTWTLACLALLALMYAGTTIHREGPSPDALDYDTAAALGTVRSLIPENAPHPTGSPANRAVADRVANGFRALGLDVERQSADLCTDLNPGCSRLENIIATLPGSGDAGGRNVLLLLSHYDSVPASPGAGDDISGTAVLLRTAQGLAQAGPYRNDIVFLVTDAEETGLRGAMAFAEDHPLADRVGLVINLEARGAAGPSALFETSVGNRTLIDSYAEVATRPVSSSLMVEVYRRMPNGTDLTIFIDDEIPALNFAYSGAGSLYHTERDDSDRLSPASLAHHGEQMLGLARHWADRDLAEASAEGDATYVDLFGRAVINWPQAWNLPAAVIALVLLGFLFLRAGGGWRGIVAGLAAPIVLLVLHPLVGAVLKLPLATWPGANLLDHPAPLAGDIAVFAGSVALAALVGAGIGRRVPARSLLFGAWFVYAALALVLTLTLPGGAYIGLLPALVFLVSAIVETTVRRGAYPFIAAHLGLVVAAYMGIYHYNVLDALGSFHATAMRMGALALFAIAAAPLLAGYRETARVTVLKPVAAVIGIVVVATVAAWFSPVATPDRPRWANLVYDQSADGDHEPQWRLNSYGLPAPVAAPAMGFDGEPAPVDLAGVPGRPMYTRPAPDLALAAPTVDILSDETRGEARQLRLALRGAREGFMLLLAFDSAEDIIALESGETVLIESDGRGYASFNGFGNAPIELQLTLPAGGEASATLVEFSALPDHADIRAMLDARPADTSPVQRGDHAELRRRITF